ncbi:hypothetical protein Tco_0296310 [Tanacetum coccineum]
MEKTMNHLDKISQAGVDDRGKLLKTLNRVSKTLEADSALKEAMQKMAKSNNTTSGNITSLSEVLRNAQPLEILNQLNSFQSTLNTLSSQCASIFESLKEEHEFNSRLLRAAEGYIQNFTRLTRIANSLQAINLPSFHQRITTIENTQVTMQADIVSIKGMVTEIFQAFKGISSSIPQAVQQFQQSHSMKSVQPLGGEFTKTCGYLAKPPSFTKGEKLSNVETTKEAETEDVKMEPKHQPRVTRPIPITIVRPLTKHAPELEMTGSSSRI